MMELMCQPGQRLLTATEKYEGCVWTNNLVFCSDYNAIKLINSVNG